MSRLGTYEFLPGEVLFGPFRADNANFIEIVGDLDTVQDVLNLGSLQKEARLNSWSEVPPRQRGPLEAVELPWLL